MGRDKWKRSQMLEREWWLRWKERTDQKQAKIILMERAEILKNIIHKYGGSDKNRILQIGPAANGEIHFIPGERHAIDPLATFFKENFVELIDAEVLFIEGIAENLPYENKFFNVIVILNVLDHCCNPRQVMNEIDRCLSPGGLLLLQVNLYSTFGAILHTVFGFLDREHPASVTLRFLAAYMENRYTVLEESLHKIGLPDYDLLKRAVLMVAGSFKFIPADYRMVAQKRT
ncbi:MAG: hypothetical protein A2Y62_15815 [Candidatus Fischerbacteria bacterium RBG_13_37_8]|uniref:Methyltransferase type 11 domain-containing protein n=1 Tax=Candidatus Fischerbacteria bacterium RBG_13_37_8 TaxID=1817863 RepID=A0A1F5VVD9_9BACT|nr:MAG: hypothetical protein A2Y62_15815 [Candidatus Fischerbacteria bacterium RBG_13_37_8]